MAILGATSEVATLKQALVKAASAATLTATAQSQEGLARAMALADGDQPQKEDGPRAGGTPLIN